MGTISKNFSYREFEKSFEADKKGINNVITTAALRDAVKALTLDVLQPLRDAIGLPVVISSGYRCKELNALIGGSKSSQHMKGEAADIYVEMNPGNWPADIPMPRYPSIQLAFAILALGLPFDQLIVYDSFVHVSHKLSGTQRGQVLFDKSYKGLRI